MFLSNYLQNDCSGDYSRYSFAESNCEDESMSNSEQMMHQMPTKSKLVQFFEEADGQIQQLSNEIVHLNLSQKQSNAVFTLCIDLIAKNRHLNTQLLENNISMEPEEICIITSDFITDKLSSFKTTYKYKAAVSQNPLFVPPQQKTLGTRFEMKKVKAANIAVPKVIQSKMQYISISETIKSLFQRQDFHDAFFNHNNGKHQCTDGVYMDFCCGNLYKKNDLFQSNDICLQIQISADDFELCSPLKSKANIHKICGVYFTIRNLPSQYLSQVNNIFLLALCYSDDLKNKQCDFNNIWRLIVDEIKILENDGIKLQCGSTIKGTISFCTFDNLGAHISLGFANSFSCKNNCRFCQNSSLEYQNIFNESQSRMRTKESYEQCIERIKSMTKIDYKVTCGIKSHCELNRLQYYHIIENKSIDIMHDINEGVIPKCMHTFFSKLLPLKLFNEKQLIQKIQYFDFGEMYQKNLPSIIVLSKDNLGQNATQSKCLFFHLPHIFYELRHDERLDDVWSAIKCLCRITQTIYSNKIIERDLISMEEDISTFIKLHRKMGGKVTPKIHFMIHYANTIRHMGPPVHMSMIRFESKHKHLKDLVKHTHNFQNILFSIAMKHQEKLVLVSNSYNDKSESSKHTNISNTDFTNYSNIPEFEFTDPSEVKTMKWYSFNGYRYNRGVLVSQNNILNEIHNIIMVNDKIHFICSKYEIITMDVFLNSFQIRKLEPGALTVVKFSDLNNKKPYARKIIENDIFVLAETLDLKSSIDLACLF